MIDRRREKRTNGGSTVSYIGFFSDVNPFAAPKRQHVRPPVGVSPRLLFTINKKKTALTEYTRQSEDRRLDEALSYATFVDENVKFAGRELADTII